MPATIYHLIQPINKVDAKSIICRKRAHLDEKGNINTRQNKCFKGLWGQQARYKVGVLFIGMIYCAVFIVASFSSKIEMKVIR